jgi:hypothetical protein
LIACNCVETITSLCIRTGKGIVWREDFDITRCGVGEGVLTIVRLAGRKKIEI